ncbi:MAG: hypothetical protein HY000_27540, partial [Planctomycetes bacterium]|nr:hypothetical protein [Planctomycetota bacterium]
MAFPPTHRPTLWAAAGYLAIVAVLFHRLLLGEVLSPAANLWDDVPFFSEAREDLSPYYNGIQGDVWRTFEPWHIYQYRSVREGRFPLWNPHVFCGFPFHANAISGTLSPLQSPYYVIDPKWAAGPVAAVVLWLAGFGAYCLGRRLGMVPVGAFVAGAAWMLCAFNVRWLLWPIAGIGAWLPLLLLALDGVIERVSLRRLALAGLAATGFQLTGHPEIQFQAGVLSGLFVLVRVCLLPMSWRDRAGRVLVCLAAHLIGLLGAAAAIVPFVEQMLASADWHEATRARESMLPSIALLGALAPDHFGRPRAGRFYQGPEDYVEAGLYFGLVP